MELLAQITGELPRIEDGDDAVSVGREFGADTKLLMPTTWLSGVDVLAQELLRARLEESMRALSA